jgi:hypothetical protein
MASAPVPDPRSRVSPKRPAGPGRPRFIEIRVAAARCQEAKVGRVSRCLVGYTVAPALGSSAVEVATAGVAVVRAADLRAVAPGRRIALVCLPNLRMQPEQLTALGSRSATLATLTLWA